MGLSRSTFYDAQPVPMAPNEVLVRISAICDEFECNGLPPRGSGPPPPGRGCKRQEASPPDARE